MTYCAGGYYEDRFQASVDKNFFCPICKDVLKDPVQCHNEHYFCKACITQHLKNSQTCPVCMEKVTEETLTEPPRIVTNYLDGLIINCGHSERGCTELIELGRLEAHISVCSCRPVTCPNEKCTTTTNMADLEQHTSEVCEYRQVHCEECEKDMTFRKYRKHGCVISKDVQAMKASLLQVQDQVKEISDTQKEILEAIKHLLPAGNKMSATEVKTSPTHGTKPQENIVVVGGQNGMIMKRSWLSSVEMYSLANRTWIKLSPMQHGRASPTAHFYNGQVMVTGGHCAIRSATKTVEYIQIYSDTSNELSPFNCTNARSAPELHNFLFELPFECSGHKTIILNNELWLVGGYWFDGQWLCSDAIYAMPLGSLSSYTFKYQMPKTISYHGLEIVDDNKLLIMGGTTTGKYCDAVDTVLLYNTVTNSLRELQPLPFPMLDMATIKHGEDVIIIGGTSKEGKYLNTVFTYNWKRNQWKQMPGMIHKRAECAAVISGDKVFVMGGYSKEQRYLSSVECFDFEHQVWNELPSMNEAKYKIAAVLVPCFCQLTGS